MQAEAHWRSRSGLGLAFASCPSAAEELSLSHTVPSTVAHHPLPAVCLLSEPGWVWRLASGLANPPEAGPLGRKPERCTESLPLWFSAALLPSL